MTGAHEGVRRRSSAKDGAGAGAAVGAQAAPADTPVAPARTPSVLHIEHAADWLHLPALHLGYRVHHNEPSHAWSSWFSIHNDTLNIWTHAAGLLYYVLMIAPVFRELARLESTTLERVYFAIYFFGALAQMGTSTLYHTFRCVGPEWGDWYLWLDVKGIIVKIFTSYVIGLGLGFADRPPYIVGYLTVLAALLSYGNYLSSLPELATSPSLQMRYYLSMGVAVAFGALPCSHCLYTAPEPLAGLMKEAASTMLGFYSVGFIFFVTRWPESIFPGRFDIVGASHQLWHVFVFLAGRAWLLGMLQMLEASKALDAAQLQLPIGGDAASAAAIAAASGAESVEAAALSALLGVH